MDDIYDSGLNGLKRLEETKEIYRFTMLELKREEDRRRENRGIFEKRKKILAFLARKKEAEIIRKEDLKKHDVAFFQYNIWDIEDGLGRVMVDYEINEKKGELITQKLYWAMQGTYLKTMIFNLERYGISWRAWDAMPTPAQMDMIWNE